MTKNVYRTAQGKTIDMGALTLQNELVRAVGNMNVNARGDRIDEANQVIDQRNRQVQRQYRRQSNVTNSPAHSSTVTAKQAKLQADSIAEAPDQELIMDPVSVSPVQAAPVDLSVDPAAVPSSGLAAALAKAKTVKQTLDPSAKQQAQAQGLRKL